jgi:hypothetical protein
MNKRFKELAIEARLIGPEYKGFMHHRLSIEQEKFAELIIQECVASILKGIQDTDHSDLVYNAMLTAIVADIHESFGIKSKQETFSQAIKDVFKDGVDLSGQKTP